MKLHDAGVVVTGGAGGIGVALSRAALAHGARGVLVVDRDAAGAQAAAELLGDRAFGLGADVTDLDALSAAVARAETEFGVVDVFFSNAGVETPGGIELADAVWDRHWQVNVLAHVRAARAVFPGMAERGGGHLVITGSAAALLADLASAPYTASKHATLGLAQWLAITHWDAGIRVSCVCPLAVATPMIDGAFGYRPDLVAAGHAPAELQNPDHVAEFVMAGLAEDRFLLLPDPDVATYAQRKAGDPERWLAGMRRFRTRTLALQDDLDAT